MRLYQVAITHPYVNSRCGTKQRACLLYQEAFAVLPRMYMVNAHQYSQSQDPVPDTAGHTTTSAPSSAQPQSQSGSPGVDRKRARDQMQIVVYAM
eukprot:2452638-Rhodomonas_salina.1